MEYIGKTLENRYQLKKLIGSGGMANVFEAEDLEENRIVAVKLLKKEYLTNEEFVRRFRNESRVISVLDHPNIVKVYDVNFTGEDQYIVMEYIDGVTLNQYIHHQGQLRWKDAVHFLRQILQALQHAHDHGVVHRDIKSQNIMLLRDRDHQGHGLRDRAVCPGGYPQRPQQGDRLGPLYQPRAGLRRGIGRQERHLFGRRPAVRDALRQRPL